MGSISGWGEVRTPYYGAPLGSPDSPKWINFGKSFKRPLTLPRPIFGNKYYKLIFGDLVTAACFGAYWHCFTVNYSLMIKENVQYICLIDRWIGLDGMDGWISGWSLLIMLSSGSTRGVPVLANSLTRLSWASKRRNPEGKYYSWQAFSIFVFVLSCLLMFNRGRCKKKRNHPSKSKDFLVKQKDVNS